jgi:N6-L-threonylcarbamoyladenine synthase
LLILGIESSCDETSAAVVEDGRRILSNRIASQIAVHRPYGGVVPELASRQHLVHIGPTVDGALQEAGVGLGEIDAVAVTQGPGLVGSLLVGLCYGKALAYARGIPLVAVDHIEAHIRAAYLECPEPIAHPAMSLVVSGGHTSLFLMKEESQYELVGKTRDDAAGEAYDKVAKRLGLGYPGGPILDRLAQLGNPEAFRLPIAKISDGSQDFSFSGLKTAVLRAVQSNNIQPVAQGQDPEGRPDIVDLAASFQNAVVGALIKKTEQAVRKHRARSVLVSGGVAANSSLRARFEAFGRKLDIPVWFPSVALSTDNAAMVAAAGYLKHSRGEFAGWDLNADVELRLGESSRRRSRRYR